MSRSFFSFSFATIVLGLLSTTALAQTTLTGTVSSNGEPVPFANILIQNSRLGAASDAEGKFTIENVPAGTHTVVASSMGFLNKEKEVIVKSRGKVILNFKLEQDVALISEVVVSGTMKEVSKLESAVPVEVYSPKFFKANPTPSVYEALQIVNGVRPQINCSVCNTGDIHINGLKAHTPWCSSTECLSSAVVSQQCMA